MNFLMLRLGYLRNDHKIIARSVVNSIPRADPFAIAENVFITTKQSSLQKRVSKKLPNFLSRLTVGSSGRKYNTFNLFCPFGKLDNYIIISNFKRSS